MVLGSLGDLDLFIDLVSEVWEATATDGRAGKVTESLEKMASGTAGGLESGEAGGGLGGAAQTSDTGSTEGLEVRQSLPFT